MEKKKITNEEKKIEQIRIYGDLVNNVEMAAPYQRCYDYLSENLYGEEIYEQYVNDENLHDQTIEMKKQEAASTSAVFNVMKEPWMEYISWLPDMHQLYDLNYEDGVDRIATLLEEIDKELNQKDEESGIAYIRERVIGRYLKEVKKIISYLEEFTDIVPLLHSILKEANQYGNSLQKQLQWLKEHPEKLALLLRFARLSTFIFSVRPDGSDILIFNQQLSNLLKNGNYGNIGDDFFKLGLGMLEEKTENVEDGRGQDKKSITYITYAVYYKKSKVKKSIKGLICMIKQYEKEENQIFNHEPYAVTKQVWEGKE